MQTKETTFKKVEIGEVFTFDGNPNLCRKLRATKYRDLTTAKEFAIAYTDNSKVTVQINHPASDTYMQNAPLATPKRSQTVRGRSIE